MPVAITPIRVFYGILFLFLSTFTVHAQTMTGADASPQIGCIGFAFEQAPEYQIGFRPSGVAAADLDGDGVVDIAAAIKTSDSPLVDEAYGFSVLRGSGQGKFTAKIEFLFPSSVIFADRIYLHDLNGDNKPDVILSTGSWSRFAVARNTSSGPGNISFDTPVNFGGQVEGQIGSIAFADIDGDGATDIAAADHSFGRLSVFLNTGYNTPTISFAPRVDTTYTGGAAIAAGDLDGDGRIDVAHGKGVLRNTSSGPGQVSFVNFAIETFAGLSLADLDGDGKLDLAGHNAVQVFVMRNQSTPGSLSFAAKQAFDVGNLTAPAQVDVVTADMDGDGRADLVNNNPGSNSITVLRNTSPGPGTIQMSPRQHDFGSGYYPYRIFVADLDGDQKRDVVTANIESHSVSVVINRSSVGTLDFRTRRDYVTASKATVSNVAAADFDLDGDLDIAASYYRQNVFVFSVYRNDGAGRFPVRTDVDPKIGSVVPRYLDSADLDNDGRPDIALGVDGGAFFYRNVSGGPGDLAFQTAGAITYSGQGQTVKFYFLDIDNNDKKDLLAVIKLFNGENRAVVYRNDTPGPSAIQFQEVASIQLIGPSTGAPKLAVGDFDLNGTDDFAYATDAITPESVKRFFIRFHLGNGLTFETREIDSPQGFQFGGLISSDVDRDGRMDILTLDDRYYNDLFYLRNTASAGSVSFAAPVIFGNAFLEPVHVGDFDANGKLDVFGPQSFTSTVRLVGNIIDGPGNELRSTRTAFAGPSLTGGGSFAFGDFDNDKRLDVATGFAGGSNGAVSVLLGRPCAPTTRSTYDFDGDGRTDIGVYRPSNGIWNINRSRDGFYGQQFGASGDKIVPADYDGDGKTDLAVFRPSTGVWFVYNSADGSSGGGSWGDATDIPAPGDFDGDGKADIAVFRPATGSWWLKQTSAGTAVVQYGAAGDIPEVGDYDGDGKADLAVFRPSTGIWYIRRSMAGDTAAQFGEAGDKIVPADYDGDGKTDIAVYRPSTGVWFITNSSGGYTSYQFGFETDIPVPGDYDGDGKADMAIFRPSDGNWWINGTKNGVYVVGWGMAGDRPTPSAFVN